MTYWIVIEENETGYEAYCPDLEDCRGTGDCVDGAEWEVRDAIESHFDGLCSDGTLPADLTFQHLRVDVTVIQ